jgi:hypothetical protein
VKRSVGVEIEREADGIKIERDWVLVKYKLLEKAYDFFSLIYESYKNR